jgi:hypothetical protein
MDGSIITFNSKHTPLSPKGKLSKFVGSSDLQFSLSKTALYQRDPNPSIKDLNDITLEWWAEVNPTGAQEVPILQVKKFFAKMGFCPDLDTAEKTMIRKLGYKTETIEYIDFYKLFCLSIFKVALVDMLNEIDNMSKNNEELPLVIKLGAYRRRRMLMGLDDELLPE